MLCLHSLHYVCTVIVPLIRDKTIPLHIGKRVINDVTKADINILREELAACWAILRPVGVITSSYSARH